MLRAISLLLACQLVGETIHRLIRVPLPGAVIGMVLLMIWLHVRRKERTELGTLSGWLTAHLALMFVPAAVGLIEEGKALSRYGVGLVTATIVSTLLTMAVTAYVFQFALRRSAVAAER